MHRAAESYIHVEERGRLRSYTHQTCEGIEQKTSSLGHAALHLFYLIVHLDGMNYQEEARNVSEESTAHD